MVDVDATFYKGELIYPEFSESETGYKGISKGKNG